MSSQDKSKFAAGIFEQQQQNQRHNSHQQLDQQQSHHPFQAIEFSLDTTLSYPPAIVDQQQQHLENSAHLVVRTQSPHQTSHVQHSSLHQQQQHHLHHQLGQYDVQVQPILMEMHSATTLNAPSPPDSASPVSMSSSSPIPPALMSLSNDRPPDNNSLCHTSLALQVATDCQSTYSTAPQGTAHFHHHITTSNPYLRIIEQPTNRIRYRYKSEKGSHGGLTGESSTPNKKTYPTVKLENFRPTGQIIIKASLVTNEAQPKIHVHKLMGRHCNDDGVCIVPLAENGSATFQNLGILFVGKKEVPEILFQRKLEEQRVLRAIHNGIQLSESENQRLREEAERDAKHINLNCVRICFEAFDCSQNTSIPLCEAVFSRSVANQKSPDSGELKIVRMDKYSGTCTGDDEIFLLCEKVNKKEIKVRFFETDSEGVQRWEAFASFTEADVHHQVAIVFRTPPYRVLDLDEYVQVYLQLYRPKDSEYSEPRPFTYCPRAERCEPKPPIETKRKKIGHGLTSSDSSSFGPMGDSISYFDPCQQ